MFLFALLRSFIHAVDLRWRFKFCIYVLCCEASQWVGRPLTGGSLWVCVEVYKLCFFLLYCEASQWRPLTGLVRLQIVGLR